MDEMLHGNVNWQINSTFRMSYVIPYLWNLLPLQGVQINIWMIYRNQDIKNNCNIQAGVSRVNFPIVFDVETKP